jgi:ATP-dependent 26S proteasome regulatory subunit
MQPCICELQNLNVLNGNPSTDLEAGNKILGILSKSIQSFRGRAALFITVSKAELANLPIDITKLALFEYICDDLNAEDRFLFAKFVRKHYNAKVNLEWLSDSIRGLTLSELNQLINEASVCANKHNRQELHQFDFDWALNQRNKAFGESIGVPKIPTVTWNDVGGLDDAKQLISESLRANLNPNRLPNMRRSGIVLWGAPGCGKTLIAKGTSDINQLFNY